MSSGGVAPHGRAATAHTVAATEHCPRHPVAATTLAHRPMYLHTHTHAPRRLAPCTALAAFALTLACAGTPTPPQSSPARVVTEESVRPAAVSVSPRGMPTVTPAAEGTPAPAVQPAESTTDPPAATTVATGRVFRGRSEDDWLRAMATRPVARLVSRHSSTAIVYHFDLGDGVEIGFKPERPRQEGYWRHEVVTYRLARVLGITDRVPPVVGRRIPMAAFGPTARGDQLIASGHDGSVLGSASVWMPVLRGAQLHLQPARHDWNAWMNPGLPLPPEHADAARQVAMVLLLDYLQSNYDRWNCCNVPVDEHGDIVIRDNDAGWYLGPLLHLGTPTVVHRLPRSVWEALQRADPAALRAEVERDPLASEGLLGADQYRAYETRRQRLIERVQGLIARYGEAAVLPWP